MAAKKKIAATEIRFEEAIERLEEIIERMETERVPLDDLLKDYEEGTGLLKLCRERIGAARLRVEKINQDLSRATPGDEPFDDEAEAASRPGADGGNQIDEAEADHSDDEIQLL